MAKKKRSLSNPAPNNLIGKSFRAAGQTALKPRKANVVGKSFGSSGARYLNSVRKRTKRGK